MCKGGAFDMASNGDLGNASLDCSANNRIVDNYNPASFTNNPVVRFIINGSGNTPLQLGGFGCNQGKFQGVTFKNFDLLHAGGSPPSTVGIFQNNCVGNDMVLEDMIIDGFGVGINWGGPNVAKAVLRRVEIKNSWSQGTLGGFGNDSLWEDSWFHHNALVCGTLAPGSCGGNHGTYLGIQSTTTGVIIRRNRWSNNCENAGKCACGVMPLRGGNGLIFEDNIVDATDSSTTGTRATSICNFKIGQNGTSTESDGCQNCIFRRNIIKNFDNVDLEGAVNTVWENNVISQVGSTFSPSTTLMGLHLFNASGSGTDLPITDNVTIRNNSFYLSGGVTEAHGIRFSITEGSSYEVTGNTVRIVGSSGNSSCFDYLASTIGLFESDYNVCLSENVNNYARASGSARSLASMRTVMGGCPNSGNECGSLFTDPLYTDPNNHDLTLQSTSPAINLAPTSASALFATQDFDEHVRPFGAGFEAGAYEFESGTPPIENFRGILLRGGGLR